MTNNLRDFRVKRTVIGANPLTLRDYLPIVCTILVLLVLNLVGFAHKFGWI